ncbi:serine/threonine-protein phosphatase [Sphingomonadales bacterium 56]|uniref:PP2C family protein-serine/threonine phosphatase n=1 Tax=Sphingobium sp. S6 TaxID=2758386 RepID=UPI00191A9560|nr:protein phosphatase 2C domain-containing protein [Sphingobium sp. S6]MBY2929367.1 serine/threonine-protein phosphatase [Sphingomonadales bacterium 56]CAD7339314.1 Serine/threonine phosphatase stp [Sphingobium sp. S6]
MLEAKPQYLCMLASHQGLVRQTNEDACAATTSGDERQPAFWEGFVPSEGGWVLLADGMGGHTAGEVASQLAIACLSELTDLLTTEAGIRSAVAATHEAIINAMLEDDSLAGMGTTVAGVLLMGAEAIAFNVGDTRIYLLSDTLQQVSEDHVAGRHVLTRCLGGFNSTPSTPWIGRIPMRPGDQLLLCSDGLTDMVSEAEIECGLRSTKKPVEHLVEAALREGGGDNVTVGVIHRIA